MKQFVLGLCLFMWLGILEADAQVLFTYAEPQFGYCVPTDIQFNDLTSPQPTSWQWVVTGPDPKTSSNENPGFTFTIPGDYQVCLSVNNNPTPVYCEDFTFYAPPIASFIVDPAYSADGCAPHTVCFLNTSTEGDGMIDSVEWDLGIPPRNTDYNACITYPGKNELQVSLIVWDENGCQDDFITPPGFIEVYDPPDPSFFALPMSSCDVPLEVQITNTTFVPAGQSFDFNWDFDGPGANPATSTAQHPGTVTYSQEGSFDITLETDDNGCTKDTTVVDAVVIDLLTADFTYSPASPCEDQQVTFTNTSNLAGTNCYWFIGVNPVPVSTNCNFNYIFDNDANYLVTLVVETPDGLCADTISRNIVVRDRPFASFTSDETNACTTPFTVDFTAISAEAITWMWESDPAAGVVWSDPNAENPSATFNSPGLYDISLTVTSATGCETVWNVNNYIEISDQIPVQIVSDPPGREGCVPFDIDFTANANLPADATVTGYNWTMNGGSPSTGSTQTVSTTYNSTGDYNVSVEVTFSGGCASTTASTLVEVGNLPILTADIVPADICLNESVSATATSNLPNTQFDWYFEPPGGFINGGLGTSSDVQYLYDEQWQQPFNVMLVGENNGCKDTIFTPVTVYPPGAQFDWVRSCDPRTEVTFTPDTDLGIFSDNIVYYVDGMLGSPIHTANTMANAGFTYDFGSLGIYEVQMVVSSSFTGCTDSVTHVINLYNTQPNATVTPRSTCPGDTVSFFDATPNIDTWQWNYGDGTVSGIAGSPTTFEHVYTASGIYDAYIYTRNDLGCRDTLGPVEIYVGGGIADISGVLGACMPPHSTNFDAGTGSDFIFGAVSANWEINYNGGFGELTGPLVTPVYDFSANGTYDVYVEVFDSIGCSDDTTVRVLVGNVEANFIADVTNICPGQPVHFTNLSLGGNLAYQWDFGDGVGTSTEQNPTYDYPTTGTFTVTLTVTDTVGNCGDTEIKMAYIVAVGFISDFIASPRNRDCPPLSVNFSLVPPVAPGNVDYVKWYYALSNEIPYSGETAEGFTVGFNQYLEGGPDTGPLGEGYYDVAVVVQIGECRDSIYKNNYIRVGGQRGTFSFTPDTICVGESVLFYQIDVDRVDSIIWDFGGGNILEAPVSIDNLNITYTEAGVYSPLVLLTNEQCPPIPRYPGKDLYVSDLIAGSWIDRDYLCDEGNIEFRDSSEVPASEFTFDFVTDILWDFGDGTTSTASNPVHYYSGITGDVDITLSLETDFGCTDDTTFTISIYETPDGQVGPPATICIGESVQLMASGAPNYLWTPASQIVNNMSPNPTAIPNDTTEFMVIMYDNLLCPDTGFVTVNVLTRVDGVAGPDAEICLGQSVQLEAIPLETSLNGTTTYTWTPATSLSNPNIPDPIATPTSTIIYTVTIESGSCIPDQANVLVEVGGTPFVNAGPDQVISAGESVSLLAFSPNIVTYTWFDIDGNFIDNQQGIIVTPESSTSYIVEVGNEACRDLDTVDILILEECDQGRAAVPNIFTPNDDGVNDMLRVRPGLGVAEIGTFRIFNRWGELVFETNSESVEWDGTQGGQPLDPGVFVYYMELICTNNDRSIRKGNITLVK